MLKSNGSAVAVRLAAIGGYFEQSGQKRHTPEFPDCMIMIFILAATSLIYFRTMVMRLRSRSSVKQALHMSIT